ncbi:unnamed protein product [Caenorhabditis angaria]|uniref:F-box domain-containing protein n=1 Tax=Caenorhabditis angaria TaxID=860376 RepID=A0A9P1MXS6_9PELO|nr:unnamed protein product [Caenorhabditis angaria]
MDVLEFFSQFADYEFEQRSKLRRCKLFHGWQLLPNELKQFIISLMSFRTRIRLSRCSKSDNLHVKTVGFPIFYICIEDTVRIIEEFNENEHVQVIHLSIHFDTVGEDLLVLDYIQEKGDATKCYLLRHYLESGEWINNKEMKSVYRKEDYRSTALLDIHQLLNQSKSKIKELNVLMTSFALQSIFVNSLKRVERFHIESVDLQYIAWWIEKMQPGVLKHLKIESSKVLIELEDYKVKLSADFIEYISKQLYNCDYIDMINAVPMFTEEQFLNLNRESLFFHIDSRSILTTSSINKFLKKWVRGELPANFVELGVYMDITSAGVVTDILNGISWFESWLGEFFQREYLFCEDFIETYGDGIFTVVRNRANDMEAILRFNPTSILFVVTGKAYHGKILHRVPRVC